MTSSQQRAELQRRIWAIANEVRGAVDGWDFKQYVLGTLFYRFISENFANYLEGGDDSVDYAALNDAAISPDIREDAIKTKGYFIAPSQMFANVAATAHTNDSLNTDLADIFKSIEASANGLRLPLKSGVLSFVQNVDKELRNGGKASTCGIHAGI